MSSPVNVTKALSAGTGAKDWVLLNRWGPSAYQVSMVLSGAATYDLEGTNSRLNRGETAIVFKIDDAQFTPITGQTGDKAFELSKAPVEAVRINQTAGAGSVTLYVKLQGASN